MAQHFVVIMFSGPRFDKRTRRAKFSTLAEAVGPAGDDEEWVSTQACNQAVHGTYVDGAINQIEMTGNRVSREAIASMLNVETSKFEDLVSPALVNTGRDEQRSPSVAKLLSGRHTDPHTCGAYGLPAFDATVELVCANAFTLTQLAFRFCPSDCPKSLLDEAMPLKRVVSVGKLFYPAIKPSRAPEPLRQANVSAFARAVHNICGTCE